MIKSIYMLVELDDKGRLVIEKEIREKYGKRFELFEALGEIVLLPVPDDPVKAMEEEGKKLPKKISVADLKAKARAIALKEAMGNLDRLEKLKKKAK